MACLSPGPRHHRESREQSQAGFNGLEHRSKFTPTQGQNSRQKNICTIQRVQEPAGKSVRWNDVGRSFEPCFVSANKTILYKLISRPSGSFGALYVRQKCTQLSLKQGYSPDILTFGKIARVPASIIYTTFLLIF